MNQIVSYGDSAGHRSPNRRKLNLQNVPVHVLNTMEIVPDNTQQSPSPKEPPSPAAPTSPKLARTTPKDAAPTAGRRSTWISDAARASGSYPVVTSRSNIQNPKSTIGNQSTNLRVHRSQRTVLHRAKQGASYQLKELMFQNLASGNYQVFQLC
jgi:hypothetical protein